VQLAEGNAPHRIEDPARGRPPGQSDVQTTRHYHSRESGAFTRIIHTLGTTVGAMMAFGALLGVLNSMYSAAATRSSEIATEFRRTNRGIRAA
jgi:putative ABC transport system permease protein